MNVKLIPMEFVRANMERGPEYFNEEFPGSFLLPIGLVSADEMDDPADTRRKVQMTEEIPVIEPPEETFAISFEERMKHAVASHPLAGSVFFIRHIMAMSPLLIGRNDSCDLTIPESSVSDRHCEMLVGDKGGLVAIDLGSRNGMSVNLERSVPGAPVMVSDEDILTFGRYSFQFFLAQSLLEALQVIYND